jgi:acetoacetyl-CoA synthetase
MGQDVRRLIPDDGRVAGRDRTRNEPASPEILWSPPADVRDRSRIGAYLAWLTTTSGRVFGSYDELWRWSVDDLEGFWTSIADFFEVPFHHPPDAVLTSRTMPGAQWFPGATLNYAEAVLAMGNGPGSDGAQRDPQDVVLISVSQSRPPLELTAHELRAAVARAAAGLRGLGVRPGDRVAAYLPNIAETVIGALATASIGAVWSSCAPEFGVRSVIDRLAQIEPRVLLTIDGYRYGPKVIERTREVEAIATALPSLRATVIVPYLHDRPPAIALPGVLTWSNLLATSAAAPDPAFEAVPFGHPLYILYSSGTTGLPKAIVHGHGGILLEHLKALALHTDLGPEDRFFWFTTTGWMMWNYLLSGLAVGSTIVLFDGDPAYPDLGALWRLAADHGITYFGTSAPFLMACRKARLQPGRESDLSLLRGVGSTGAPLPADGFRWVHDAVSESLQLGSLSGGTDLCTGFLGPSPLVPVWSGEISCRMLGARVAAYDPTGRSVVGTEGELVIEAPMPSMPVGFWNDPDGRRYRDAYFADYAGVWRHGDWLTITERGTCIVSGRSDATLNRGGVRLGTAEFYAVVEQIPEIADSLVIHLEDDAGGPGELLLFVVVRDGRVLDDDLRARISTELRRTLSPRHMPDAISAVAAVPRTLSGKKLEVPVKRILQGTPQEEAASRGSLADPRALDEFIALAAKRLSHAQGNDRG